MWSCDSSERVPGGRWVFKIEEARPQRAGPRLGAGVFHHQILVGYWRDLPVQNFSGILAGPSLLASQPFLAIQKLQKQLSEWFDLTRKMEFFVEVVRMIFSNFRDQTITQIWPTFGNRLKLNHKTKGILPWGLILAKEGVLLFELGICLCLAMHTPPWRGVRDSGGKRSTVSMRVCTQQSVRNAQEERERSRPLERRDMHTLTYVRLTD